LKNDSKMYHNCNKNETIPIYLCSVNRLIVITILTDRYHFDKKVNVVFDQPQKSILTI
jgi:hypothetical protein